MSRGKGGDILAHEPERWRLARPVAGADTIIVPTLRERELIGHIAHGLSNKLIAYEMKISPNTVRAHIGNIMRKYKLHNRTQIAMLLVPVLRNAGAAISRHP